MICEKCGCEKAETEFYLFPTGRRWKYCQACDPLEKPDYRIKAEYLPLSKGSGAFVSVDCIHLPVVEYEALLKAASDSGKVTYNE